MNFLHKTSREAKEGSPGKIATRPNVSIQSRFLLRPRILLTRNDPLKKLEMAENRLLVVPRLDGFAWGNRF
jgi:hypothetical protein